MKRATLCAISSLAAAVAVGGSTARAAVTAPTGYIYSPLTLGTTTLSCVAVGPGGTFVGVGRGFTANAGAIVLAKESGEARLVAFGFNSIGDCAYDAPRDILYVTDNADNSDLKITTGVFGNTAAQSGDTVFAIPHASSATALAAPDLELLPANSVEFAANLAIDASGNVFVSNAGGGGIGTVTKISAGPTATSFVAGFDFTAGLALNPANGNLFVAESLASSENQISQYTPAGATVASPWLGPSFAFGSADLAFNTDGRLLVTGVFAGDVVAVDLGGPTINPFISGLTFANGVSVDSFTGRVSVLSSFSGGVEDNTVHRFVPVDRLVAGKDSGTYECLHEFYGLALVAAEPGGLAKKAICVDGAACDADGQVNDSCTFPVGSCLNVSDARLPECVPDADITSIKLSAGKDTRAFVAMRRATQAALPVLDPSCFFSDGVVVPVSVKPSGEKKDGKGKVAVVVENALGKKDSDVVGLVCQPASGS